MFHRAQGVGWQFRPKMYYVSRLGLGFCEGVRCECVFTGLAMC